MADELRFDERVAIVTGAGSGVGRTNALLLASRGAAVVVNELAEGIDRAQAVVDEIVAAGGRAAAVAGRIGVDADAQSLVTAALDSFGRIDIVVNNAGLAGGATPMDTLVQDAPEDRLEAQLDVNVRGPLQLNRAAWPHFVAQGYGRILLTSSINATAWMKGPHGYEADYAAAKAAMIPVTRQTAGAGREHGIKANALMPWAYSRMVEEAVAGTELGTWMQENLRPEQVSAGILPLLHDSCPVTGETFSVEGGRVARVFYASTRGYFNPDLTPEDVVAHWDEILGGVAEDGGLRDVFELSQPREERVVASMLENGVLPDVSWIAQQPIKEANLATG